MKQFPVPVIKTRRSSLFFCPTFALYAALYINFFYISSCIALQAWVEEPELITMASLTSHVQARYYTIERIQKKMQTLYAIYQKHPELMLLPDSFFDNNYSPSLAPVSQCLEQMRVQHTITPFFELWRQLRSYKYIDNPTIALEFSQLLWRIMQHIVAQLLDKKLITKLAPDLALDQDTGSTPSPSAIAFRFYLIRRLEAVTAYLADYQKTVCANSHHKIVSSCPDSSNHNLVTNLVTQKSITSLLCSAENLLVHTSLTHPQIIAYKDRLQKEKNLAPLLHLLADIQQFKSTESVSFAQESLQLIFVIYKALSNQQSNNNSHQDTIPLATLSIEELLDSIDIMTENIAQQEAQEKAGAAAPSTGQALCSACSALWHYATSSFSGTRAPEPCRPYLSKTEYGAASQISPHAQAILPRSSNPLSISEIIEQDYGFTANQFTNYIYRRFYFIKRLEKIMDTFSRLNKTLSLSTPHAPTNSRSGHDTDIKTILYQNRRINIDRIFDVDNTDAFVHPIIKKSLNTIKTKRNLRPLFTVWDSFKSYKLIEDQLLIEEFTKEIFVISRNLLLSSLESRNLDNFDITESRQQLSLCSCCLLDLIDVYIDKFLAIQPEYNAEDTQLPHKYLHTLHDLKPLIHMDDIVERFYHVKRLERIMSQIYLLHKKGCVYQLPCSIQVKNNNNIITIDNRIRLTHPDIVSCVKVMEQTRSWTPLLQLLCEVKRYKFIQDHIFIRELSYLLFALGHTTLITELQTQENFSEQSKSRKSLSLDQLAQIYETIDGLPLENMLDAIDLLSDQIPLLLEKYAFDEKTPTWLSWLRKHWWHASVDALKLSLKLLLTLKPSHILNVLLGRPNAHHNYYSGGGQHHNYGQNGQAAPPGQNNQAEYGHGAGMPAHDMQEMDQIFRAEF